MPPILLAELSPMPLLQELIAAAILCWLAWLVVRRRDLRSDLGVPRLGSALVITAISVLALEALAAWAIPDERYAASWVVMIISAVIGCLCSQLQRMTSKARLSMRRGWWKSSVAAVAIGPMLGALLGWLTVRFGEVSSLDVGWTYRVFISIGTVAGVAAGLLMAASSVGGPVEVGSDSAR
jgi:hypothetical protein